MENAGVKRPAPNAGKNDKNYANRKFYNESFAAADLSHADFRGSTFVDCNFQDSDCSYANFEGANCFRCNFKNAKLYRTNFKDCPLAKCNMEAKDWFGATITLSCETFDGIQLGKLWWFVWLFFALIMEVPEESMKLSLVNAIGHERYQRLRELFDRRII